jgi:putative ABC transport system substrate-binding protein
VRRTSLFLIIPALTLLAAPLAAVAEQPGRVFQIGVLGNIPLTDPEGARTWGAFIQGLRELGYVEGQNITIEHRDTTPPERPERWR